MEFRMPQLSMGMREAVVLSWFRAEGDEVREGDDLVEIEAEKVTVTLASPVSGTVAEIRVPADTEVEVQQVLALIDEAEPPE